MRYILPASFLVLTMLYLVLPAHAAESMLNAIRSDKELSDFYMLMEKTATTNALGEDEEYIVFAPSNDHLKKVTKDYEKCLRAEPCKKVLGNLIRNHIVTKVQSLRDAAKYKKGLFSINGHFIPLGTTSGTYPMVEGKRVLTSRKVDNGVLYVIDGPLASKYEMSLLEAHKYAAEPVIEKKTTTQKSTIPDPACGPEGCPDKKTTVTTIKRTITEVIE